MAAAKKAFPKWHCKYILGACLYKSEYSSGHEITHNHSHGCQKPAQLRQIGNAIIKPQFRQYTFLALALTGICATWYFNIEHIAEDGGFSIGRFLSDVYANPASSSIGNDLVVVAATFLYWSYSEAKRLKMKFWFAYVVLTFAIAIAFAFPLFMFMRERKLSQMNVT